MCMRPGEYMISQGDIQANAGRDTVSIQVPNTGDRPVQVGPHAHFFAVNRALSFERRQAYGFRLNIPAGTSVRFEPGDSRRVELTEYGGRRIVFGVSGLVNGSLDDKKDDALRTRQEGGVLGAFHCPNPAGRTGRLSATDA